MTPPNFSSMWIKFIIRAHMSISRHQYVLSPLGLIFPVSDLVLIPSRNPNGAKKEFVLAHVKRNPVGTTIASQLIPDR
jgi:hypothetical protein